MILWADVQGIWGALAVGHGALELLPVGAAMIFSESARIFLKCGLIG